MTEFLAFNDSDNQKYSRLILCIEEHDVTPGKTTNLSNTIDNRLFIGWSEQNQEYFVRGKRQDTRSTDYVPYNFKSKYTDDLYDLIEFFVGNEGINKSIMIYNYNNIEEYKIPTLTYEFFESNMDKNYEISGYDNVKLKRRELMKYLRLLKNIVN